LEETILNGNEDGENIVDGRKRLTEAQAEKLTAYSICGLTLLVNLGIAWSPSTAKGEAILAVGAASGETTLWRSIFLV
jgi:hypothetical protein